MLAVAADSVSARSRFLQMELSYWRIVFPQMANELPQDGARELSSQFAAELARLEAAPGVNAAAVAVAPAPPLALGPIG